MDPCVDGCRQWIKSLVEEEQLQQQHSCHLRWQSLASCVHVSLFSPVEGRTREQVMSVSSCDGIIRSHHLIRYHRQKRRNLS